MLVMSACVYSNPLSSTWGKDTGLLDSHDSWVSHEHKFAQIFLKLHTSFLPALTIIENIKKIGRKKL